MCQGPVRKLCNPSERGHVRKVAHLLAQPLSLSSVLPDAPSTHSSTPTPPVPPAGRDTPQRRFLGLIRNSPRGHFCFSGVPEVRQGGKEQTRTRYRLAEGEPLSKLKLGATDCGYLGPS